MLLSATLGFLACFLGHRILRALIALAGFLLAGIAGAAAADVAAPGNGLVVVASAGAAGLVGALSLLFAYRMGVFVLGALGAGLVAWGALLGEPGGWPLLVVLGAGLAGGALALVLEKPLMIGATAVLGAWVVVVASLVLLARFDYLPSTDALVANPDARVAVLVVWGVLAAAGVVAQAGGARKRQRRVFATRTS
jgi:hypothetical protein